MLRYRPKSPRISFPLRISLPLIKELQSHPSGDFCWFDGQLTEDAPGNFAAQFFIDRSVKVTRTSHSTANLAHWKSLLEKIQGFGEANHHGG
jgi:hypothetical protein